MLFARNPEPGRAKTRLQPHLSAAATAALYAAFVGDSADILRSTSARRKVVACATADGVAPLRRLLGDSGLDYLVQPSGDLGERMEGVLRRVFGDGAARAVLIGSDSPSLPPRLIDEGLERLVAQDAVVGPAMDGGYYLVGLRREALGEAAPALFRGIGWGDGDVLSRTVAALPAHLRLGLLPPWYDVDRPSQAAFLRAHLEALARGGDGTVGRRSRLALRDLDLPPSA